MAMARALCNSLPVRARQKCRRRKATALQRRWLRQLAWGPDPATARQVQL
jgi:hypothetical protein